MGRKPLALAAIAAALCVTSPSLRAAPPPPPAAPTVPTTEIVIPSGPLKLRGFVVKPRGDGPFPAVVYNHGSGRENDILHYDALSAWWQAQGYVVVYPFRR